MSMATGEYVSVSSQSDTEKADLKREAAELRAHPVGEQRELETIYVKRGLEPDLARKVAEQLMAKESSRPRVRDELGISEATAPRPIQAALAARLPARLASALLFVAAAAFASADAAVWIVSAASLVGLAALGAVGARVGGAPVVRGTGRVVFWGALAMATTGVAGALFGARG